MTQFASCPGCGHVIAVGVRCPYCHREPTLRFDLRSSAGPPTALQIVPVIDGTDLSALVGAYEREMGYEPSGQYGGLILGRFDFGDPVEYFDGARNDQYYGEVGRIDVLLCKCGEEGCWPLRARVERLPDTVTWLDFQQPHRPEWDYQSFGPFRFPPSDYDEAVASLIDRLTGA